MKKMTLEDKIYTELKSLGFTAERILEMSEKERRLWVQAVKPFAERQR